jgi:hypothetical protein
MDRWMKTNGQAGDARVGARKAGIAAIAKAQ